MKNRIFKFANILFTKVKSFNLIIKSQLDLPIFKNASHLFFGTGISYILGFLFWIIAVRLYDSSVIGMTFALLSVLNLFAIIAELGFSIGLIRFLPSAGKDENSLINSCFTLSSLISMLLAILFIFGLPIWGSTLIPLFDNLIFSSIFIIFSIFFTLIFLIPHIFLGKRITKFIIYINLITGSIKIGLLFIFIFISHSVFGLFLVTGLSIFFSILIATYVFLPKVIPSFHPFPIINFELLRGIRNYSTINYISNLFLQFTPLILPLMIINFLGPEMNAYFQISWSFIAIAQVVPIALFNSLFVESTHEEKINFVTLKRASYLMFASLIPISILLIIIPNFFLSFYGATYADQGSSLLRILALSIIPWGIIYLFISVERLKKSAKRIIYITFLSAVMSIVLSYLLMIKWGLIGIGIGYLTGQLIVAMIATIFLLKIIKSGSTLKT